MLFDSNLIIYAATPEHAKLREFVSTVLPAVSSVSMVEVLGHPQLSPERREYFESFFASCEVLPVSQAVIDAAVTLRQAKRMTLGDALIAATALVHRRELLTKNVRDFRHIPDLALSNPREVLPPTQ